MEKGVRTRLLDAGLELMGTEGERRCTVRAAEDLADVPHGSLRHHFGDRDGFVRALVEQLLVVDRPRPGESVDQTVARWLGPDLVTTRARYELILVASRDEALRRTMVAARERVVAEVVDALGARPETARSLVAALDGLVLDAVLRGATSVETGPTLAALVGGGRGGPT